MRKERTQRIHDDLDGQSMSVEEAHFSYILLYDQICCKMNPCRVYIGIARDRVRCISTLYYNWASWINTRVI